MWLRKFVRSTGASIFDHMGTDGIKKRFVSDGITKTGTVPQASALPKATQKKSVVSVSRAVPSEEKQTPEAPYLGGRRVVSGEDGVSILGEKQPPSGELREGGAVIKGVDPGGERFTLPRSSSEVLAPEARSRIREETFFRTKGQLPGGMNRTRGISLSSPRSLAVKAGIAGIATVVIAATLLSTVFARLTVTVKPRVESIFLEDVAITIDAAITEPQIAQKLLPAERLQFSQSITEEFAATGSTGEGTRSRGKVRVYNAFSSAPQPFVAQTRFITEAGTLYRISRPITIPGAKIEGKKLVPQFVEVELVADQPGEESNQNGEITLKLPGLRGTQKYERFYAVALSGFEGGASSAERLVSQEDLERAQQEATKKAYLALQEEMARKTPKGFVAPDSLRELGIVKVDAPKAGVAQDPFRVTATARGVALIFREQDVAALLRDLVLKDDSTQAFISGSLALQYQPRTIQFDRGKADVVLRGTFKTKRTFSEAELVNLVRGKKEGSLIEALRGRNEFTSFHVSLFPPWRFRAPGNSSKIHFVVEGE